MQVKRIHISQFKKFNQPIAIDNLQAGINIFYGPNESGKSTIAQAIRTAFLEKHSTGTVADLQPWGDTSASPEVTIEFEHAAQKYILKKRFLRQRLCSLNIDGKLLDGEAAEQHLADLFGYSLAGRGSSRPEHWGVPGLLWVEQGRAQEISESVEHASHTLQAILNMSIGDVGSSDGDKVLKAVEQRLFLLTTPSTSAPKGEYKNALDQQQQLAEELDHINNQLNSYHNQLERLTNLKQEHKQADLAKPWVALMQQAEQARQQLAALTALKVEHEQAEKDLATSTTTQHLLHNNLRSIDSHKQTVVVREQEYKSQQELLEALKSAGAAMEQQYSEVKRKYDQVSKQLLAVRGANDLKSQWESISTNKRELEQVKVNLSKAKELHEQIAASNLLAAQLYINKHDLEHIQQQKYELQRLEISKQALATKLSVELQSGQSLLLNRERHAQSFEQLLTQQAVLEIENVGQIKITPGGENIASLDRNLKQLSTELQHKLSALGVDSVDQLKQRNAQYNVLQDQIKQYQSMLELYAPDGIAAIENRCSQLESLSSSNYKEYELAQQKYLQEYTDTQCTNIEDGNQIIFASLQQMGLSTAQENLSKITAKLDSHEASLREHKIKLATAQASLNAAQSEYDQALKAANNPDLAQRREQLLLQLDVEQAKIISLQQAIKDLSAKLGQADINTLEQDVQRFHTSATHQQEVHAERERTIRELYGRLQTLGAQGLDESKSKFETQLRSVEKRILDYENSVKSLNILRQLLLSKKKELARRLHAPLTEKIQAYLKVLFSTPENIPTYISDHLAPSSLTRDGIDTPIEQLSFGTREQISTISRLAYADLLKEAGKPTLIMLDDALVHSDGFRLAQLKRILFAAAQRHQILLFTCHPEKWQDMGAGSYSVNELSV